MMEWLAILYDLTCCVSLVPAMAMSRAWALRHWWPGGLFLLLAFLAFWGARLAMDPGMARDDRILVLVCSAVPGLMPGIGAALVPFIRQPRSTRRTFSV